MYAHELFEAPKRTVVIYAGRFQPFHKGHRAVYDYLVKRFGRDNVYISTSNKVELPKSPFSFSDKAYFMQIQGIPMDRVVESRIPYQSQELVGNFDAANTNLIFAVSEKDRARFGSMGFKKDGSPSYFQAMPGKQDKMATLSEHGYVMVVPTFDFKVLGEPMRSATEVRAQYVAADAEQRKKIIQDLFGTYTPEAQQIMDSKLKEDVQPDAAALESRGHKILARKFSDIDARRQREAEAAKRAEAERKEKEQQELTRRAAPGKTDDEQVDEEAAGVGVIANKRQAKDPRYSMSLTKDVRPGQVQKSLRAFSLAEGLGDFHKSLGASIRDRAAQMQADLAIARAKNPEQWQWKEGDIVYSPKTGKSYKILGVALDKRHGPMYYYGKGEEGDRNYERGRFIANRAHDTLKKLNEISESEEFLVLYLNGQSVAKYKDPQEAGMMLDHLRAKFPEKNFELRKEMLEGLRDPKDNPCWKGYYPVGTKKKNGRTVPNCVPKPKK